ncbi:UNVERIFIED_CONTAM: hypothetical protein DES50_102686 [Williamsia faeni]
MPQVMPLRESRARAEKVFVMRSLGGQPWSKIRDELGFGSVGAAQMAYRRFLARNPVPDGKTVFAEILERKRVTTSAALTAMARAERDGDLQAVATLIGVVSRMDAELAKLYGLNRETVHVDLNVSASPGAILDRAEADLLALAQRHPQIIDAEVVEP